MNLAKKSLISYLIANGISIPHYYKTKLKNEIEYWKK